MELTLDGPIVRPAVIVLSAIAVYVGPGIIIHVCLSGVIQNKVTRESLHTVLLTVAFGVLIYVGFWMV